MLAILEAHGLEVPQATSRSCGTPRSDQQPPRPMFREAEQQIIQKGLEVAERVEQIQRTEHSIKMQ